MRRGYPGPDPDMAIFSLSVKSINRKSSRSSVAAAAYRSCLSLTDERTGQTFDFRRKRSISRRDLDSFIVAPADAEWAADRATLWNTAEAAENRGNSTTGREWLIALPAELDDTERADLARRFAGRLVERFGVAADVSIHRPDRAGDERNHHAHILTTARVAGPAGLGAKTRELDVSSSSKKAVEEMRAEWAAMINTRLAERGLDSRVDHRSFERQGIDQIPEIHMGPAATAAARAGRTTARGDRQTARQTANRISFARQAAQQSPAPPAPIRISRRAAIAAAAARRAAAPPGPPRPIEVDQAAILARLAQERQAVEAAEKRRRLKAAAAARRAQPPAERLARVLAHAAGGRTEIPRHAAGRLLQISQIDPERAGRKPVDGFRFTDPSIHLNFRMMAADLLNRPDPHLAVRTMLRLLRAAWRLMRAQLIPLEVVRRPGQTPPTPPRGRRRGRDFGLD